MACTSRQCNSPYQSPGKSDAPGGRASPASWQARPKVRHEENPSHDDGNEGHHHPMSVPTGRLQPGNRRVAQAVPRMIDHQENAMQSAPDDEGPAGTVPILSSMVASRLRYRRPGPLRLPPRKVQVVAEKTRERDVPAPPEFDDVDGLVGR